MNNQDWISILENLNFRIDHEDGKVTIIDTDINKLIGAGKDLREALLDAAKNTEKWRREV